ncbi:pilin [Stenotrophomonas sp. NPDC077464]|uniref:pilin n=1 Tax=unclassified Stenotrophomonas TaxID=196198 RepID=UPI0037D50F28
MSQWFYAEGNRQQRGPLTSEELIALYQSSRIALDTLVWRDGLPQWQPLRSVADEIGLDAAAEAPPVGPPPAPAVPSPPRIPGFDTPDPRAVTPGPAPGYATAPSYPRAAPPPKKTSGCLVIGLVVGVAFLVVVAILAAIALPAYNDYVHRAKVANAVAIVSPLKNQVSVYALETNRCPVNGDDGFQSPGAYAADYVAAVRIGRFGEDKCGIEMEFAVPGKRALDGKMLWFEYDMQRQEWTCSSDLDSKYVPTQCRG